MKRETDTWYWVWDPREGDIFWPIFVNIEGTYYMDGKVVTKKIKNGLNKLSWTKAVMPDPNN